MTAKPIAVFLALFLGGIARPAEVLYVRSNGDLQKKKGQYSALFLLDGDPTTVWCSQGTGTGAQLEIVFDEVTDINAMEVWNGNQESEKTFADFSRVKKLQFSIRDMSHTVELRDERTAQKFRFDPALHDRRVVVKLLGGYRGKNMRHACLSDLIFYWNKKPLWGKNIRPAIAASLPYLDYIGTWVAGPEYARNRELVLSIHNTFFYTFLPEEPSRSAVRVSGTWKVSDGGLELLLSKQKIRVEESREDSGELRKLRIESQENLPEGMEQVYVRYQFW